MRRTLRVVLLVVLVAIVIPLVAIPWYVSQPFVRGTLPAAPPRLVEPRDLETHVRMIATTFVPRDYTHPENLDRVAAYVEESLRGAGGRISQQGYKAMDRYPRTRTRATFRNVMGSFGPDGGARIVVGAHYDAADEFPGADDNASGVAGLIELGNLLGETRDLRLGVDLVAYTLEEPPFFATPAMGSWVHAEWLRSESVPVRAMISLEMIGCFSDAPRSQELPHPALALLYSSRGDFIAIVGRAGETWLVRRAKGAMRGASDLPVYSINAPPWLFPGIDFSDHRSFWAQGYPAIMITDTAFYRNPRYHTIKDTPDTLDYARMAKVVRGVYQIVLALSQ